jgi:Secretion system C-terminal sorting domain
MIKKITLLAISLGFAGSMFAQTLENSANYPSQPTLRPGYNRSVFNSKFGQNNNRTSEEYWLSYAASVDSIYGNIAELNSNYLSWDSLLLGEFGSPAVYEPIWINNIGDILDINADAFQQTTGINWNSWNNYTVDSMALVYAYERNNPNTSIVDTLVVQLYHNATATNMPTYYFQGATMLTNFGFDTVYFRAIRYLYQTNSINAPGVVVTYKIPLTAADTAATFFREKVWSTNAFAVPGGRIVGSSITFKPGYTYALGDTVANNNAFYFGSYEEQGAGTFHIYNYCPNSASPQCDWNVSSLVTTQGRYNTYPANSWNGLFIPSWAYTNATYSYEHHLVSYKVSTLNVGVQEEVAANATLGQNIPNPATGETTIRYNLAAAGDVQLDIFDVTGKLVMSFDQGNQSTGSYQINFSTENLEAGVYFYSLNVNGSKITRRMVVAD